MKKKIPLGAKLPVKLTVHERNIILDEIEEVQAFVAAEANHTENKKLETELDRIFIKLQVYLDSYDDREE